MKSRYVKAIYVYYSSKGNSVIGKIYKVEGDVPFSEKYNWEKVTSGNTEDYFREATEEEYNIQEGIITKTEPYEIY